MIGVVAKGKAVSPSHASAFTMQEAHDHAA